MGCCYMESRPRLVFSDMESAEKYAKELNESEEGKEFVERFAWDDVEYKVFIEEIAII